MGQRFGTAHVTNVLRGSDAENIRTRRHDQLSTFGLLKEATTDEVRGYIINCSRTDCCSKPTTIIPCCS